MLLDTAVSRHSSAARPYALLKWQHCRRHSLGSTQLLLSQTTHRLRLGVSTCQGPFPVAGLHVVSFVLIARGFSATDADSSLGPGSSPRRASLATTDIAKRHVCPAS